MTDLHEPWRDEAIKSTADDRLGRSHLAARAASLVKQVHSWDSSVVFGLTGPWGSGKTSLISMIEEHLSSGDEDWAIAKFTPWSASDVASLLAEFYAALGSAMPKKRGRGVRRAMEVCARVAAPALTAIPFAGGVVSEGAKAAADALGTSEPWDVAFREASQRIQELKIPVLVVADDVDRLQLDELMTLLKVVRLLGRFPGVNFLLAYDEQTLLTSLRSSGQGGSDTNQARLFMEKIVQYPFVVPPLLPTQIAVRIDEGLTRLMAEAGRPLRRHEQRLANLLENFQSQLQTPRSIDRFLAQLNFMVPMHQIGEVDDIDLILLTFIRMQFPNLWLQLPKWRLPLTGQVSLRHWSVNRDKAPDWDQLFALVPVAAQDDARDVLGELFPPIHGGKPRSSGPYISNGTYFNRYFANTIPDDDVADTTVTEAIAEAGTPGSSGSRIKELLFSKYPGRADLALSKIRERFAWKTDTVPVRQSTVNLVRIAAEIPNSLDDGARSMFSLRDQAVYWLADVLRSVPQETTTDELEGSLAYLLDEGHRMWAVWESLHRTGEGAAPSALIELAGRLAERAEDRIIEHLRMRDEAPEDESRSFDFEFVRDHGAAAKLAERIKSEIGTSFRIDDLAARFVTVLYMVAESSIARLGEFKRDLFVVFAPYSDQADAPRPETEPRDYDISWPNRRAFALTMWGRPDGGNESV